MRLWLCALIMMGAAAAQDAPSVQHFERAAQPGAAPLFSHDPPSEGRHWSSYKYFLPRHIVIDCNASKLLSIRMHTDAREIASKAAFTWFYRAGDEPAVHSVEFKIIPGKSTYHIDLSKTALWTGTASRVYFGIYVNPDEITEAELEYIGIGPMTLRGRLSAMAYDYRYGANAWKPPVFATLMALMAVCLLLVFLRRKRPEDAFTPDIAPIPGSRLIIELLLVLLVCLAIKAAFLAVDSYPIIHGDSAAYLKSSYFLDESALRPKGYPIFIRSVRLITGSEHPFAIIAAQSVLGALTSLFVFYFLRRRAGASAAISWAAALIVTCSPMQLALERNILAEALTLLIMVWWLLLLERSFRRPGVPTLIGVGALASMLTILRFAYVFAAPLSVGLYFLGGLLRGQVFRPQLYLSTLCIALAAATTSTVYKYHFAMLGAAPSKDHCEAGDFGSWRLWCRVCPLAEAGDLDRYEWGPALLSDIEDLRTKNQTWNANSATRRFMSERRMTRAQGAQLFKQASLGIIMAHPFGYAKSVLEQMFRYVKPGINRDFTIQLEPISRDKDWLYYFDKDPRFQLRFDEEDMLMPYETIFHQPYRLWTWLRWVFLAGITIGFLFGLWRWRTHYALLAFTAFAWASFTLVNMTSNVADRYFQPVEVIGVISWAFLLTAWRSRKALNPPTAP